MDRWKRLVVGVVLTVPTIVLAPPGSYSGNVEDEGGSSENIIPMLVGLTLISKGLIPFAMKAYWSLRGMPYDIEREHWAKDQFLNYDWLWGFAILFILAAARGILR
jgi:hypothetical protein